MPEHEVDARWLRLWARFGASNAQARVAWQDLVTRYSTPERAYHTIHHVLDCQREFDDARALAAAPDALEAALWYHDAVYDPQRSDNEETSANLAREVLIRAGMRPECVEKVKRLILATRHAAVSEDEDAALIVDIDLSILGAPRERFEWYEEAIRAEYSTVPEVIFRAKRAELLEGFLSRTSLYATQTFRTRFEAQARMNLTRSIELLRRGA